MGYNARMKRTLLAGGPDGVAVEVERRRVRRLNLRVRPDGTAHLSIPQRATLAEAQRFLDGHADWLRRHVARQAARAAEAEAASRDGLLPLWGELVALPAGMTADELYRAELERRLPEVARRMEEATGARASGWQLRAMSSRWGSATPRTGHIRINVRLAAYPPTCLDYVVAHELTHLLEPATTSGSTPFSPARTPPSAPPGPSCAARRARSRQPTRSQPITRTKQAPGKLPSIVSERKAVNAPSRAHRSSRRPAARWRSCVVVDKDDPPLGLTRPRAHT